MKINNKKTIYAWCLKYSDKIGNLLYWAEGQAGVEYAVLDAVYKNKGAFNNIPTMIKDRLVRVKITIEEVIDDNKGEK